jgi:hypothetical protein
VKNLLQLLRDCRRNRLENQDYLEFVITGRNSIGMRDLPPQLSAKRGHALAWQSQRSQDRSRRSSIRLKIASALSIASAMANSLAGHGLLPISLSFRAARIVAETEWRTSVARPCGNLHVWIQN